LKRKPFIYSIEKIKNTLRLKIKISYYEIIQGSKGAREQGSKGAREILIKKE